MTRRDADARQAICRSDRGNATWVGIAQETGGDVLCGAVSNGSAETHIRPHVDVSTVLCRRITTLYRRRGKQYGTDRIARLFTTARHLRMSKARLFISLSYLTLCFQLTTQHHCGSQTQEIDLRFS